MTNYYLNFTRETWQSQKKIYDDVISENCETIFIFPIYGQFLAIRKSDSGGILQKLKTKQNISTTALILLLWVKVIFLPKEC